MAGKPQSGPMMAETDDIDMRYSPSVGWMQNVKSHVHVLYIV